VKIAVVFSVIIAISLSLIFVVNETEPKFETYLERSVPFVGVDIPRQEGFDGTGIKVAVIDTGVDYNHPDLYGWGPDGKVIGGYNFINEGKPPLDINGHGTQVAGVIAADGEIKGVAPKVKILAYKVSEDGEGVSSDLIIRAINMAIDDGANIINISLGVNKTNSKISAAVNNALDSGIFVVTAAGNDGPEKGTIGSPGSNYGSVTVGATYNNLTSSLVATLEVDEKPYTVIPMVGSKKLEEPIIAEIKFGGFAKKDDLKDIDVRDSILLVERGSDVKDELLYFSTKEKNAAEVGVIALIVYNNQPGIFLGELIHEFVEPDYSPEIPVVSMDRIEGLEIKEKLEKNNKGVLKLFYNPDFVAHFSSRGPVSPFYIKPDMVAPGAYINTTNNIAGYNFTSGTSYAAPHVSGAAALLLQKYPEMHHHEIKSLLLTTVAPVSDEYGQDFKFRDAGAGRLDISKAFEAKMIILPPNFVVSLSSDDPNFEKQLELKLLKGTLDNLDVTFVGPEFIEFSHTIQENTLQLKMQATGENYGDYEGKLIINHQEFGYVIPFLLYYTEGSISVKQDNGKLEFVIYHPEEWNFAKISLINSNNEKTEVTSATPTKDTTISVYKNGEYWVEAKIRVNGTTFDAYKIINVDSVLESANQMEFFNIPERQVGIVLGITVIVGIIGMLIQRKQS